MLREFQFSLLRNKFYYATTQYAIYLNALCLGKHHARIASEQSADGKVHGMSSMVVMGAQKQ